MQRGELSIYLRVGRLPEEERCSELWACRQTGAQRGAHSSLGTWWVGQGLWAGNLLMWSLSFQPRDLCGEAMQEILGKLH